MHTTKLELYSFNRLEKVWRDLKRNCNIGTPLGKDFGMNGMGISEGPIYLKQLGMASTKS